MPAPSSIYWNSEDSQRSSWEGSERNSSSSAVSSRGRRYVDPWDLENYAYLRRRQIEIKLPRNNEDVDEVLRANASPNLNNSSNDSYYWYPMPVIRETASGTSGQEGSSDFYHGDSHREENSPRNNEANFYPLQQAISYEEEAHRYVTPNPVYVPLSDIEYSETVTEQVFPKILPRRRNRVIKNLTKHLEEECPCPFHGPLPADVAMAKEMGTANKPAKKQLGLNTYGHLRIDYAKSWNSLNRKMKK